MKNIVFQIMVNVQQRFTGPLLRNVGKRLYEVGTKIQGQYGSEDRLVPSLRSLTYNGIKPQLQQSDFVAPNATVLGNVKLGDKSSIWYNATLLGNQGITIGTNTVIQDRVHISRNTNIGNYVFIGPNSILQGSQLHNRSFVAMGATVKHATVQKGGFVAAGAVVQDNTIVKQGQVWAGNPAKFLRLMTPLQRQVINQHLEQMQQLAVIHSQQTQKSKRQLLNGQSWRNEVSMQEYAEHFLQGASVGYSEGDQQFVQQRVLIKKKLQYPEISKDYQPYIYDQSQFSQKFNVGVHDEDVRRVATKLKQKEQFENDKKAWKNSY